MCRQDLLFLAVALSYSAAGFVQFLGLVATILPQKVNLAAIALILWVEIKRAKVM